MNGSGIQVKICRVHLENKPERRKFIPICSAQFMQKITVLNDICHHVTIITIIMEKYHILSNNVIMKYWYVRFWYAMLRRLPDYCCILCVSTALQPCWNCCWLGSFGWIYENISTHFSSFGDTKWGEIKETSWQ